MIPWIARALATWRVTHLFMYEIGPFRVITRLRTLAGVRHDDEGLPLAYPDNSVFSCFLCCSMWVGMVLAFTPNWAVKPLAMSTLAIWSEKWIANGPR